MFKKFKIRLEVLFLVLLLIVVYGCGQKSSGGVDIGLVKGTDGIVINFLKSNPQDSYLVSIEEEPITVVVEVRNKGSYPREDDDNILSRGQIYISGFDTSIIDMEQNSERLNRQFLQGKSSFNPEGGFDTVEFTGSIFADNIIVDKYEPTILATLCYPYITKASPSICIDPFPFDDKQKKVCNIGSQTLTSQGAPIAITRIDQEASTTKIQFKISLKNVGGGDVIKLNALEKCNPFEREGLEREDFDRIELVRADAGFATLNNCGPFPDGDRILRLHNGEGFIICSLDSSSYDDVRSAYITPLNLVFRYGYRTTISKPIKISKITRVN